MGRHTRKNETVFVRMHTDLREWAEEKAQEAELPLSTFIRRIVEAEATRDLRQAKSRAARD